MLLPFPVRAEAQRPRDEVTDPLRLERPDWFAVPVISYSPETGAGFGVMGQYYLRNNAPADDGRSSAVRLYALYTVKNQSIVSLRPAIYWDGRKNLLVARVRFSNFPDEFSGIGSAPPPPLPDDYAEDYTDRSVSFGAEFLRLLFGRFYVGAAYDGVRRDITEIAPGGLLAGGAVPGVEGGLDSSLGPVVVWDSRDHVNAPTGGGYYRYESFFYDEAFGSDYDYFRHRFDVRRYFGVARGHVLALQLLGEFTNGDPGFEALAELGGSHLLRGIFEGRFRDRHLAAAQLEWRFPIFWRFSGVLFGGLGEVARTLEDFDGSDLKFAGGGGLRFVVDARENIPLRLDIAWGEGELGVYFSFNEAF